MPVSVAQVNVCWALSCDKYILCLAAKVSKLLEEFESQGNFRQTVHKTFLHLDGCYMMLDFFRGAPKGLWCSLVPSCSYRNPLWFQSAAIHKLSTIHWVLHVNECSVCAFPLPGNLVTVTRAARVLDPQLFALSSCQLPSMPCTNYWLWINRVLSLARTVPRLVFLADHADKCSARDKQAFMWFF